MENRTKRLASLSLQCFPAVTLAVAASVFFLDEPIAAAIDGLMRSNPMLGELTDDIPDLLLPAVLVLSAGLWTAYFLRIRKGIRDAWTGFYRLGGTALPVSFAAKSVFKPLFGRIETRSWLKNPVTPDFQWFHAGNDHAGFPSGHMTVFTALVFAYWVFFPRHRTACLLFSMLLGSVLIVTNYHFLGDVIAGGYLGLAVAAAASRVLERHPA